MKRREAVIFMFAMVTLMTIAPRPALTDVAMKVMSDADTKQAAPKVRAREPLFDGLGHVHRPVTTKSALAQKYFDQGLALSYAFNHDEASRSFAEAARIDPNLAMAYWGRALVLGPNYNMPGDKDRGRRAWALVSKAESLAANATPVERDLIAALEHRYGADGAATRVRDRAYADAMRQVAHRYPDDPDVQTLFAESLMDLRPWQLWNADGTPAPGTAEIVATLEAVLKAHPDHIGANHYYIHAVEASRDPARALASADRLGTLAPKAGHLVHMPAHIYVRTGRYHDSAETNERAITVDREYIKQTGANGPYPMMYYTHNIHFLCYSAMMEGNEEAAARAARELAAAVPFKAVREMHEAEFMSPQLYFVEARFEQWDRILKEPAPPADLTYTAAMWHYARGLAHAGKGHPEKADAELKALDAITAGTPPDRVVGSTNRARDVLRVASAVLSGEIAGARHDHTGAARKLTEAVAIQDSLIYDEPPIWYFPVRESLAAELLAGGRTKQAEQVYRDDLARNPDNPRSLYGLARCLAAEGNAGEAAEVDQRFRQAWHFADVNPPRLEIAPKRQ